jgi:hypothetical protein
MWRNINRPVGRLDCMLKYVNEMADIDLEGDREYIFRYTDLSYFMYIQLPLLTVLSFIDL